MVEMDIAGTGVLSSMMVMITEMVREMHLAVEMTRFDAELNLMPLDAIDPSPLPVSYICTISDAGILTHLNLLGVSDKRENCASTVL
jgi:hypothetical protein